ncbi:hypothetical protein M758_11G150500 [Ceratodon purpureus]|nr:hypothetical protein M758_11G150500 [Ceratodon purpureus]
MDSVGQKGQDTSTYSESEGYIADDETRPSTTAVDNHTHGGFRTHSPGEGADKPTTIEKIKEKFWEVENHMKGKEPSAIEDPHPELAYITPMPQEKKPGFFSRKGHKSGGQHHEKEEARNADAAPYLKFDQEMQPAPEVQSANKGVGGSELGTGYEADGEGSMNPAVAPKNDEGIQPLSGMHEAEKGFGNSDGDSGYEEGSEGSFSHVGRISDFSFKEA